MKHKSIVILGATATGKTSLAVTCAKEFSGEIISADSRQVYKELTLGSGKDLEEYGSVPYHLIDVCDLNSEYTVFDFQRDCVASCEKIVLNNHLPIIAGGTGLYLNSVLSSYKMIEVPVNQELRKSLSSLSQGQLASYLLQLNPHLHNKTDLEIRERSIRAIEIALYKEQNPKAFSTNVNIDPMTFKINFDRSILRERIRARLKQRIKAGMVEEVESILKTQSLERVLRLGLEYKFTSLYIRGNYSFEEYFEKLFIAICQFAKRQETWFRKMEREGVSMIGLDGSNPNSMLSTIKKAFFSS